LLIITNTGEELLATSTSMTLNDLEPPYERGFSKFFVILRFVTDFKSELYRNPRKNPSCECQLLRSVSLDWFTVGFHTCTAVARLLCVSWAFLFVTAFHSVRYLSREVKYRSIGKLNLARFDITTRLRS